MEFTNDSENTVFQLAASLVSDTNRTLFLTGKAGTGKTTFLKQIKESANKTLTIAAPTGVAAINAGGMTLHSLFQIPFGCFVPEGNYNHPQFEIYNPYTLIRKLRLSGEKQKLLRKIELLIIDEVSMMRVDTLDAIDEILRHVRRKPQLPFGGVQVLYIGDLFQLPPVVQDDQWEILGQHYETPFFFSAKVVKQCPPLYIELKKVYRQNEENFINLLNAIRNGRLSQKETELLESRYQPNFDIKNETEYITLTTHNYRADSINEDALNALQGTPKIYHGKIDGDFPEHALPVDRDLRLKVGAQVMFMKNDIGEERQYYNGLIGQIKSLNNESITVHIPSQDKDITVVPDEWKNIKYIVKKDSDKVEEEITGTYTQYPLRLAWAVTIHKSQGLTFQKAVIDAGKAFAPGQVYVALSRCTTLGGMVLTSLINPNSIRVDERIKAFAANEQDVSELSSILKIERPRYYGNLLKSFFDWSDIVELFRNLLEETNGKRLPDTDTAMAMHRSCLNVARELHDVSTKFQHQLDRILYQVYIDEDITLLKERVEKAIDYLSKRHKEELFDPFKAFTKTLTAVTGAKAYNKLLSDALRVLFHHYKQVRTVHYANIPLYTPVKEEIDVPVPVEEKAKKGESIIHTIDFFNQGLSIAEIAEKRMLAVSTIEGHLAKAVSMGEIEIEKVLSKEKIDAIQNVIYTMEDITGTTPIKEQLGDEYSYNEIRMVLNHVHRLKESAQ